MAEGADAEMEEAETVSVARDNGSVAPANRSAPQALEQAWTFRLDYTQAEASGQAASGSSAHTFSTVDEFWSLYNNNILHPSKLGVGADLSCLKNKIDPKWEDPNCANGGKWIISCGEGKSEILWLRTLMALIGEQFEYGDEICGAVLSVRGMQETIAIWTKDAANELAQLSISKQWMEFLDYNGSIECIVHDSSETTVQCWSYKFPQDPLDIIYNRVPDARSRVRFAAVCRSWFDTASRHPAPPALPWLLLSPRDYDRMKRLYCPEDNHILPLRLPRGFVGSWFVGCHDGGWVASYEPAHFRIVNLFSGFEVALSEKQKWIPRPVRLSKVIVWKIIFSKPPTSSDCIVAAITDLSSVGLCKVGCPDGGWTTHGIGLADIAFFNGELYGLTSGDWELVKLHIGLNEEGAPVVTAIDRPLVTIEHQQAPHDWVNNMDVSYIFELKGKLAMAVRFPWSPNLRSFFKVFELVDVDSGQGVAPWTYRWEEVKSLGDFALFLGPNCSMAVHVPEERHGGVQRNRIYYTNCRRLERQEVLEQGDLVLLARSSESNDNGYPVYLREDNHDGVEMIRAVGYYAREGPILPMWLLPPDL